jgi:hypothetical protein
MDYLIKKGRHYCNKWFPKLHSGDSLLSVNVRFTSSCLYSFNNKNQQDWNKLAGLSYGYHKHNSVRIAWRCNLETSRIELALYCYVDGERFIVPFEESFKLYNQVNVFFIVLPSGIVAYAMENRNGDNYSRVKLDKKIKLKLGYLLKPYFGGNEVAPHDVTIYVENLS